MSKITLKQVKDEEKLIITDTREKFEQVIDMLIKADAVSCNGRLFSKLKEPKNNYEEKAIGFYHDGDGWCFTTSENTAEDLTPVNLEEISEPKENELDEKEFDSPKIPDFGEFMASMLGGMMGPKVQSMKVPAKHGKKFSRVIDLLQAKMILDEDNVGDLLDQIEKLIKGEK